MRSGLRIVSFVVALGLFASIAAAAESPAVQEMASILMVLNHFPGAGDKQTLTEMTKDQKLSAHERTLAQALINVQHKVSEEDRAKLEAIVNDQSAPASIRTLATAIININHTASVADKAKLKTLVE